MRCEPRASGGALPAFGALPTPAGQRKVVRNVFGCGPAVVEHRCRPGEPRDELEPKRRVGWDTDVVECEREGRDGSTVHLFVRSITAVHPGHSGVVADRLGVGRRAAELLGPVRGQPLRVLRMNTALERMRQDRVGEAASVPRLGERHDSLGSAHRFVD